MKTLCKPISLLSVLLLNLNSVIYASENDSLSVNLKDVVVEASNIKQVGNKQLITITRNMRKGKTSTAQMLGDLPNFYYNPAD